MTERGYPDKIELPTREQMEEHCLSGLTPAQKEWAKKKIQSCKDVLMEPLYKHIRLQAQQACGLKLVVTDHGDPSVGIFPQSWEVECPFLMDESAPEEVELFREIILKVYQEFSEGKLSAVYDFENTDDYDAPDFQRDETEFPILGDEEHSEDH